MPKKFPSKPKLRIAGIVNPWMLSQFTPDKVWISFTPADYGRGGRCACYQIHRGQEKTEAGGPWYNYGKKTFDCGGLYTKEKALALAIQWANDRYGEREWVRDPFGSYQDARAVAPAWEAVKAGTVSEQQ